MEMTVMTMVVLERSNDIEIREKVVDFREEDNDSDDDWRLIELQDDNGFDVEMMMIPIIMSGGVFSFEIGQNKKGFYRLDRRFVLFHQPNPV